MTVDMEWRYRQIRDEYKDAIGSPGSLSKAANFGGEDDSEMLVRIYNIEGLEQRLADLERSGRQ
jgi:hypothetical protein